MFETSGRIEEICVFVLTKWLELVWTYLKKKYSVREIQYFTNIIFASGIAVLCYKFPKEKNVMKHKYVSIGNLLLSDEKVIEDNQDTEKLN